MKATDQTGVNISADFVGGPYFQDNLDVAARDGRIVTLGALGGTKLPAGVTSVLSSGNAFDLKGVVCEVETLTIK